MNKLTVLAKNAETYFIKRLTEEVGGQVDIINPWDKKIPRSKGKTILVRTTGVYGGDQDLKYLSSLDESNVIVNAIDGLARFRSKKTQYLFFDELCIPQLPWYDLNEGCEVQNFLGDFPFPEYLIKPHRGQGGWGIKVFSPKEVLAWLQSSLDREYILQPYLAKTRELRCFFIGDHYWTLERMRAPQMIVANFKQEGEARPVANDHRLIEIIERIKSSVDIHYGAVDALITESGPIVLELNTVPGVEQLEKSSGTNILSYLLRSLPQ